jgi:hypothetical protein
MAGSMVDFVVLPRHRTLFPAISLQRELKRHALTRCEILYGLPNPMSLAAIRRIGYKPVGKMVRRARVLRSARYLSRYLPSALSNAVGWIVDRIRMTHIAIQRPAHGGFRAEWRDRPDSRFDSLWARAADPNVLMGIRDSAFLSWRFSECPLQAYRFFTLVSETDNRLVGYAACESLQGAMHVRDFLVDPAVPGAGVRLWLDLAAEAYRQGLVTMSVDFLGSPETQRQIEAAGMRVRAERPVYASATGRWGERIQDRRWYLTCADEDS